MKFNQIIFKHPDITHKNEIKLSSIKKKNKPRLPADKMLQMPADTVHWSRKKIKKR